jgi:[calcium/calmodulin-dependent protein kinase] kinase
MQQRKRQSVVSNECPPSPDDMMAWDKQDEAEQAQHQEESYFSTVDSLPEPAYARLVPSSSEDHFTSMSQSTSNPSIPSVASADSSVRTDESAYFPEHAHGARKESGGEELFISVDQRAAYAEASSIEDFAYDGDHAVESDDDTDSDNSFVEMTRHKSKRVGLTRSESISNGELALHRERRATNENQSIRSARSGSNNTMKKVRSRNESEDEGRPRPLSAAV